MFGSIGLEHRETNLRLSGTSCAQCQILDLHACFYEHGIFGCGVSCVINNHMFQNIFKILSKHTDNAWISIVCYDYGLHYILLKGDIGCWFLSQAFVTVAILVNNL